MEHQLYISKWLFLSYLVVSVKLVQAKNLDWRLFRVSDQRLIKWFGKFCCIFELRLHLNWAMPDSLPASFVYLQQLINSLLSRNMHILPFEILKIPKICTWVLVTFEDIKNGHHSLHIRDNGEFIQYLFLKTIDEGRVVGMAQFKCKLSSNIQEVSRNTFWVFETRNSCQSKFSA